MWPWTVVYFALMRGFGAGAGSKDPALPCAKRVVIVWAGELPGGQAKLSKTKPEPQRPAGIGIPPIISSLMEMFEKRDLTQKWLWPDRPWNVITFPENPDGNHE